MRREYRLQEPPFCVTPELTEGCNLYCNFCGLQGIRTQEVKNYKYMAPETMTSLMTQMRDLKWNSRIEFAMRGEPTMHPDYAGMVGIVHEYRPQAHKLMLSNGGGLLRKPGPAENILALFRSGLNVLGLDDYRHASIIGKILEAIGEVESGTMHPLGFMFYRYPADQRGNPHKRRPPGTKMLVIIQDISDMAGGNHSTVSNTAGTAFEKKYNRNTERCHQPFRQLAVRYDGNVPICCADWRGVYKCGSVVENGLEAVWQGKAMGAAREVLIKGQRASLDPCNGCDSRTYRPGLLPDKFGKAQLHAPDEQTLKDIAESIAGPSYTAPVLRPWELPGYVAEERTVQGSLFNARD